MQRRHALAAPCVASAVARCAACGSALAADAGPFKIGFILPMTGQSASTGKQIEAAVKLYLAQNGNDRRRAQGRGDHQGRRRRRRHDAPDRAGAGRQRQGRRPRRLRPDAARARDRADRDAEQDADGRDRGGHVDASPTTSPYIVRTSFTLPQATVPMADWAAKNGIKKVVTFVADYGPGLDAEKFFKSQFTLDGGQIVGEIRSPLQQPRLRAVPAEGRRHQARRACSCSCRRARARRS